jgi:poly-D-alanine transfer protein DltD
MSRALPSSIPDLLVFGSSVAWRHFDGEQAIETGLAKNPYNLGFCGMRLSQTKFVARYFLAKQKFQFPHRAVIIASPQDFESCHGSEEQVFSKSQADEAIFSPAHAWELYLQNVDPVPFVRNASVVKAMRNGANNLDRLIFTKYGDGPIDSDQSRGLTYGRITDLEQPCFSALRELVRQLSDHKIQTTLVLTPINPRWIAEYDPDRRILNELRSRTSEALKKSDVLVWDASESKSFSESDFVDAIHLRWSAVSRLTTAMAGVVN